MRRARVFLVAMALVVLLAGCRADAHLALTMGEDGSGEVVVTVTLDADAASRVPGLADDLRVADLEATGWAVEGPTDTEGGGVELTATKPFTTPEQGRLVLREVGGQGGILRGLTLDRGHTFGETTWAFGGTLDLAAGLAAFSDDDLNEVLGDAAFGADQAALEEQLGAPLAETVRVAVTADLPGDQVDTNGDPGWSANLGDEPVAMAASSSERDTEALTFAAGAVAAAVLLALLLVVRVIRGRRRRRRRAAAPLGSSVVRTGPKGPG